MTTYRHLLPLLLLAVVTAYGLSAPAHTKPAAIYTTQGTLAVAGYDPVAYFTVGRPLKGAVGIEAVHEGVRWRFASEANRATFLANPARFMPQYGGYCAWAVSQGYTAPADPMVWKIVAGRLFLNYNSTVGRDWERNVAGNISRADANWPKVLAK